MWGHCRLNVRRSGQATPRLLHISSTGVHDRRQLKTRVPCRHFFTTPLEALSTGIALAQLDHSGMRT